MWSIGHIMQPATQPLASLAPVQAELVLVAASTSFSQIQQARSAVAPTSFFFAPHARTLVRRPVRASRFRKSLLVKLWRVFLTLADTRLDSGAYVDVYQFTGRAGQPVVIDVVSTEINPLVGLLVQTESGWLALNLPLSATYAVWVGAHSSQPAP